MSCQSVGFRKQGIRECLIEFAKTGRFHSIEKVFAINSEGTINQKMREFLNESILLDETPLHLLLPFRPPVSTVNTICKWMSAHRRECNPEETINRRGETPLHVAVKHVCDISVVERLLEGKTTSCSAMKVDYRLRHALHWACANPNGYYRAPGLWGWKKEGTEAMTLIICRLTEAFPGAASAQDVDGETPVDLAMKRKTDRRVKTALLNALLKAKSDISPSKASTAMSHTDNSAGGDDTVPWAITVSAVDKVQDSDDSSIGSRGISRRQKRVTILHELIEI